MTEPETVGVRGMKRAVPQQDQLLPPVDEVTVYTTQLAQIAVDLAFIDPLRWELQGQSGNAWECLLCEPDGWPPDERDDFVHDTTCVWWRAAVLTRPETGL